MNFNFSHRLSAAMIGTAIAIVQPQIAVPQTVDEQAIGSIAREVTVVINGQNPGSGAIISKQGNTYSVLTAKHVVATEDEYEIFTSDGTKHPLDYRTVKKLPGIDLAIVQFSSNQNYRVAILGNSDVVKEGATVYTSGWPHPGRAVTQRIYQITKGSISGRPLQSLEDGYALVYTNITRSGMSGGPVFDVDGRVIGIHGRADGEPIYNPDTGNTVDVKSGFNLGIPINSFFQLASQIGINLPYSRIEFSAFKTIETGYIESIAISPDGQILVSGGGNGRIQLWNLQTGELKSTFAGHSKLVKYLLVTPDGQTLASSSNDETIKLWNLQTGQQLHTLSGQGPLVFSSDGQTLAGISSDAKAILQWNLQTGELKKTISIELGENSIARDFSPDIQTLASADKSDLAIKIWDLRSESPPRNLQAKNNYGRLARCLRISPDGNTLATVAIADSTIWLWNLQTGELLRNFSPPTANQTSTFTISDRLPPLGRETFGQQQDAPLITSDDISDPPLDEPFNCLSASFDSNGQILAASSGAPKSVKLWNLQTGQKYSLPDASHPVAFSRDGQILVTGRLNAIGKAPSLQIWRSPGF